MKKNKVIAAIVSIGLLISAMGMTAYAEEAAEEDKSVSVESPDTGGDKGVTSAVIGAAVSAAVIVVFKKRR